MDAPQCPADRVDLAYARFGAELVNSGALLEGLRQWAKVREWGPDEVELVARVTNPDMLLNAIAEHRYGGFGGEDGLGEAVLVAGAVLGRRIAEVSKFYSTATTFLTRVVGCRYAGRLDVLEDVAVGDPVLLIREPDNQFDSNAIRVATRKGETLGYLRRTIAKRLSARLERGAALQARTALVLGDRFGPNDRLYIEVKVAEGKGEPDRN